ncbi:response regulator transcription factor [bacterium M00.F.Ca.ET.228.01.1.1]|uniref:response regulator transcription factor n=1 Tax=Paraburkholderia phenoliruptrix TaxID=252970 RepID=UPI001092176D|nr:response regulator transcription factor [Paraburkholderia phenoliruptrix]TGP40017.1 response regulator transcription factor [bacterium M00.F.Ca.ET.228.01.1.1]TGR95951.1 response regulator transcription factor [bacterium M00.F.Ca.ET.191.01.1.1]TGT97056.1 response regulator transcription factor [bacterium M00.F.Ca.ET.155.01.1.1]MBW0448727.1 response regulator transcription factor [Paraburkholderia phenoliruptrix]MBW9100411.1 response regulator transcription factor [Paraburkholderia phenolirup
MCIKVICADRHPVLLIGMQAIIEGLEEVELVGTANNCTSALRLSEEVVFDVLVTDTSAPAPDYDDWRSLVCLMRDKHPEKGVVLHSCKSNASYLSTLSSCGIHALVAKNDITGHLGIAIQSAYQGGTYLSPQLALATEAHSRLYGKPVPLSYREIEVLRLVLSGKKVTEIAQMLLRAKQTISTHKSSAMFKLGISCDAVLFKTISEEDISLLAGLRNTVRGVWN